MSHISTVTSNSSVSPEAATFPLQLGRHASREEAGEPLRDPILEQVGEAGSAIREEGYRILGIVVLGKDHHPGPRTTLAHQLGCLDSFPPEILGHPDVGHEHLGPSRLGPFHQAVEITGDADHLEVFRQLHQRPHTLSHQEIVVGEKHGDRHDPNHAGGPNEVTGGDPANWWWGKPHQQKRGRTMESGPFSNQAGHMTSHSWPTTRSSLERMLIGSGMSLLAWILERAVLRSTSRE